MMIQRLDCQQLKFFYQMQEFSKGEYKSAIQHQTTKMAVGDDAVAKAGNTATDKQCTLDIRNGLILSGGIKTEAQTDSKAVLSLSVRNSFLGRQRRLEVEAGPSGLDVEDFNLNSISSVSTDLNSSTPNSSLSGSTFSAVSNISDELFSKHQLPESSTNTLDLDHQSSPPPVAAVFNYREAPETIKTSILWNLILFAMITIAKLINDLQYYAKCDHKVV